VNGSHRAVEPANSHESLVEQMSDYLLTMGEVKAENKCFLITA